jgi:hypothetical protein
VERCRSQLGAGVIALLGSRDHLRWAKSAVGTRCFGVPTGDDRGVVPALLPVADLLDHDPHNGCEWTTTGQPSGPGLPSLRISAPIALPAGATPSMNYGRRSNAPLLLSFGFALHPNVFDLYTVLLATTAPGGLDELAPGPRQALLRARGLSRRGSLSAAHPLPEALLDTLRVCLAPDADIYAACGKEAHSLRRPRTELRVVATLRRALVQALSSVDCPGDGHLLTDAACAARGAVCVGATPAGATIWGCDEPEWCLAAYRAGQATILRSALAALEQHAAGIVPTPLTGVESEAPGSDALAGWLQSHGAAWAPLSGVPHSVQYAPGEGWAPVRPLTLARDVTAGEVLARIPAACILAAGDEVELARDIQRHAALGQASPFAPLLAPLMTLPSPVEATRAAGEVLEGTTCANAVEAEAAELDEAVPAMPTSGDGPGGAAWALAVARHACVTCGDGLRRLVPVAHALAPGLLLGAVVDAVLAADGSGDVLLLALAPLRGGTRLETPVVGADASMLLLGDAQPRAVRPGDSDQHAVELTLAPPEDDAHAALRAAAMEAMGVGGSHYLTSAVCSVLHHRVVTALLLLTCDLDQHPALALAARDCVAAHAQLLAAEREQDACEGANVYVSPAQRSSLADRVAHASDAWVASQVAVHGAVTDGMRVAAAAVLTQILEAMAEELGSAGLADVQPALAVVGAGEVWAHACVAHRDAQRDLLIAWLHQLRAPDDAAPHKRGRRV